MTTRMRNEWGERNLGRPASARRRLHLFNSVEGVQSLFMYDNRVNAYRFRDTLRQIMNTDLQEHRERIR